jgi:hypothetical protein
MIRTPTYPIIVAMMILTASNPIIKPLDSMASIAGETEPIEDSCGRCKMPERGAADDVISEKVISEGKCTPWSG